MSQRQLTAREILGLPAQSSAEAAEFAFVRLLPQHDFCPPETHLAAVADLRGRPLSGGTAHPSLETVWLSIIKHSGRPLIGATALPSQQTFERLAIERFALQFWQLPPEQRRAQWNELLQKTQTSEGRTRLMALEPGLSIVPNPITNAEVQELANLAQELFLLPPRQQGLRLAKWMLGRKAAIDWKTTSKVFQNEEPHMFALVPLLNSACMQQLASFGRMGTAMNVPNIANAGIAAPNSATMSREHSGTVGNTDNGTWLGPIITICALLIAMLVLSATKKHPQSTPKQNSNPYTPLYRTTTESYLFNPGIQSLNSTPSSRLVIRWPETVSTASNKSTRLQGNPVPPDVSLWKPAGGNAANIEEVYRMQKLHQEAHEKMNQARAASGLPTLPYVPAASMSSQPRFP